ncbi:MAG: M14 family zinc carboxypeptidase [Lachnospiraceae bacterium]|nr:M14 family zinc carboxypeptidase [Lachnospiraceae bacterium]
MSEEKRFKYLEELERSEALDGSVDSSREGRRKRRDVADVRSSTRRSNRDEAVRRKSGDSSRSTGSRKNRENAYELNAKKKNRNSYEPDGSVRSVSVSEKRLRGGGYSPDDSYDREYFERRRSGRSSGRRDGRERVTDWDAFIEETDRIAAENSLREESESQRRKRKRDNRERRREREAAKRRNMIIRLTAVLLGLAVGLIVIRTVLHFALPGEGLNTNAGRTETEATVTQGTAETDGYDYYESQTETRADVTVVPTSSVVSIDSAEQLTTLFEDWVYVPSENDIMPEGDIIPTNDTFYSHDMMKRDLYFLRERYPESVTILRFGYTADGRDLLDVVIGNPSAQKDVIIQYSIHAREYVNSLLGMKQIEELLKGMNNGTQYNGVSYEDILQGVRLHLIPMLNPDGVMIALYGFDAIGNETLRNGLYECWQSDILLGKGDPDITAYYHRWKANARCVDINRNFDCGWETTVGTPQPSCSRYKGEAPASEAETKALVALKDAINCVGQIAYHSEGEVVYWDYGSIGDLHVTDEQLADVVCGLTGYKKESTLSSKQETAGCSDYFVIECGIPAITVETGVGECPIYVDQWETIWNQNSQVIPAVAQFFAQL